MPPSSQSCCSWLNALSMNGDGISKLLAKEEERGRGKGGSGFRPTPQNKTRDRFCEALSPFPSGEVL